MTRIVLAVEYDGRGFCGFQSQPSRCGVQDALEAAIGGIADHGVTVVAAGRTDAGVHATSQVVHFDTTTTRPDSAWVRGVNARLPQAAAVLWSQAVGEDFHARFRAVARHYHYVLDNRPQRPALEAGRVGWYHRPLDVGAMRDAASRLVGRHDFSAFRAAECQAKTPVRDLSRCAIGQRGTHVHFEFSADGFLHHMIRNLVGAFIAVGNGTRDPAWMRTLLESRDRSQGAPTFAPDGLYLTGADYPAAFGLPPTRRALPDWVASERSPEAGGTP